MHYTGVIPGFPRSAQFRLDLRTGLSTNLTAVTGAALDSTPTRSSTAGETMTFVDNSRGPVPTSRR